MKGGVYRMLTKKDGFPLVADQRKLGEDGDRRVPGRTGASAGRSGIQVGLRCHAAGRYLCACAPLRSFSTFRGRMDEGDRKESDSVSEPVAETGTDVQAL